MINVSTKMFVVLCGFIFNVEWYERSKLLIMRDFFNIKKSTGTRDWIKSLERLVEGLLYY